MQSPFKEMEFFYSKALRENFRNGSQQRRWAKDYPQLFSKKDVQLAKRQPRYHFFEWLGAVLIYEATGYKSCMKWDCDNHPDALAVVRTLDSQKWWRGVLEDSRGFPDLLVYSRDFSDWFFCEVKGHTDKLGLRQIRVARRIHKETGRKVVLLQLRAV